MNHCLQNALLRWKLQNKEVARHQCTQPTMAQQPQLTTMSIVAFAGLPKFRGFELRNNPKYPNTAAWFAAIAARPAYQKVCSDDQTLQLLFQVTSSRGLSTLSSNTDVTCSSSAASVVAPLGWVMMFSQTIKQSLRCCGLLTTQALRGPSHKSMISSSLACFEATGCIQQSLACHYRQA